MKQINKTNKYINKSKNKTRRGGAQLNEPADELEPLSNNSNYENSIQGIAYERGEIYTIDLSEGIKKCVNDLPVFNRGKIIFNYNTNNIGYVTFAHIKTEKYNRFEIETIFVKDQERGKGYGKKMLKTMIMYAFEKLESNQIILQDQTNKHQYFTPTLGNYEVSKIKSSGTVLLEQ
jgi:predicted GNAT family acetyltransferase